MQTPTHAAPAKRTNSLGRATDDCFACKRIGSKAPNRCDRQRPRCNVCTEAGRVCSGYRQHFQWQGGASRANWKSRRKIDDEDLTMDQAALSDAEASSAQRSSRSARLSNAERKFEFVQEQVEGDYVDRSFSGTESGQPDKRHKTNTLTQFDPTYQHTHESQNQEIDRPPRAYSSRAQSYRPVYNYNAYGTPGSPAGMHYSAEAQDQSHPYTTQVPYHNPHSHNTQIPYASVSDQSRQPVIPTYERQRSSANYSIYPQHLSRQEFVQSPYSMSPVTATDSRLTVETANPYVDARATVAYSRRHPDVGAKIQHNLAGADQIPTVSTARTQTSAPSPRGQQSWHEIVGSPASTGPSVPSPQNQTATFVEPPREIPGDARDVSHHSYEQIEKNFGSIDAEDEELDEILPRHQDIQTDPNPRYLVLPLSNPSWHSFTSYDLKRVQHFDRFICPVPVTINKGAVMNPYRETLPYIHQIPALKHAVMAIAIQHHVANAHPRDRDQVEDQLAIIQHKTSSVSLFSETLKDRHLSKVTDGALVTAFILIMLEATQNARSEWRMHFQGVARLLEERGGVQALMSATVLKSQMAMLVWYDMSIALVGRKGCCIPYKYLEALTNCNDRYWTFFSMTGCVGELCKIVYEFCVIVAMPDFANTPAGRTQVAGLETQLDEFQAPVPEDSMLPPSDLTVASASSMVEEAHGMMHGADVWRHALLLYSARVFRRLPGSSIRVQSLARRVIDHARLIPMSENGASKQLLLPLLLAGSDEQNPLHRQFVVDYIDYWTEKLRFRVWDDAKDVLLELWEKQKQDPEADITLIDHLNGGEWMFG